MNIRIEAGKLKKIKNRQEIIHAAIDIFPLFVSEY